MLVERLMKQCQQERRIATQLMHIRKEKDTIRNNRILRQHQYAQQRELEFKQFLDKEAVSRETEFVETFFEIVVSGACSVGGEGEKGASEAPQEGVSQEPG